MEAGTAIPTDQNIWLGKHGSAGENGRVDLTYTFQIAVDDFVLMQIAEAADGSE